MTYTEKILAEYDKKFPCIETECDNNGSMVGYDREGDAEQQQCQHCFERRLPQKAFLTESIAQAIAEERARVRGVVEGKKVEGATGEASRFNFEKDWYVGYNQALDDLLSSLDKPKE